INLYKELKPDLVIMDILMSDMGGIVAIEEIIKNDRKAVILAVSGLDKSNLIELAHKKGAKAFIKKPYKIDSLLKKIKELLTNSEI
ncbi:MAG: Signal transduction response regulator, partial [Candidatus Lokiarchaeum sp. GC14_75]